jgi:hypothetical protein
VQKSKTRPSFHQQPWQAPENLNRLKTIVWKLPQQKLFVVVTNSSSAYSSILPQDTMLEDYYFGMLYGTRIQMAVSVKITASTSKT